MANGNCSPENLIYEDNTLSELLTNKRGVSERDSIFSFFYFFILV